MPFVNSFTALQLYASPNTLRITDTSTGSDANINNRLIYIRKADGTYLVPEGVTTDYIEWRTDEGNVIELNILNIDYATEIKVQWGISPSSDICTEGGIDITTESSIKIETE
jgi:hypothetical protein